MGQKGGGNIDVRILKLISKTSKYGKTIFYFTEVD